MPIHDWSRVEAGVFHDFHQSWIIAIRDVLNARLLPEDYYALVEQVAEGPIPDIVTLERRPASGPSDRSNKVRSSGASYSSAHAPVAVLDAPPVVRYTHSIDQDRYAEKSTRVAIHHVSGDELIGVIEIISPGNKHSEVAMSRFCDKIAEAIRQGIHVMVIDLHRPTPRDPRGVHARFWTDHFGDATCPGVTAEDHLGLAAYRSDLSPTAYFEPTAIGKTLIDMPAFLTPDVYVNVPLELTYQTAWSGVPKRWKEVIAA